MSELPATVDVLVIGGAVMGSAAAYFTLADPAFTGRVAVIEKDPSYARCASTLSAASIRQQFSCPVNVEASLFGIRFLRDAPTLLAVDDGPAPIDLHEGGYLFLATPEGRAALAANHATQTQLGADIVWLEPDALANRFAWLSVEGLAAGCFGHTGEGWFDGHALLSAFRRKAQSLGATYHQDTATRLLVERNRVRGAMLADGRRIEAGVTLLAAGIGTARLAATAGLDLPVRPRRRSVFAFTCATPGIVCPLLVDPAGAWVRSEGAGFICGGTPDPGQDADDESFDVDWPLFEERIWPVLAARVPAFEAIRPGRAWSGHYDMNLFDQNAVVGPVEGLAGLLIANGFSGHGLQQAPAVGRALADLIVHGAPRAVDLSALGHARIAAGRRLIERNVV